jgi:hypothetical protein
VRRMNHDALVQRGRLAWSPNTRTHDLDVWHQYDNPLAGTFVSDGRSVFFLKIIGTEVASVWAYACLTGPETEEARSAEFSSVEDLRRYAVGLLTSRKIVLALAEDLLTGHWSVTDEAGPLDDLATTFLNHVLETLSPPSDSRTMLRAKLAQVAEATAEMVDA